MKNEHSAWQTLAKLWLVFVACCHGGIVFVNRKEY
jgi:hypothetical protein